MTRSRDLLAHAFIAFAALAFATIPAAAGDSQCPDRPLTIFAAASLTDVTGDIAGAYRNDTGCKAVVSTAGTSTLARQIAEGAPADIFLSANLAWVSWLTNKNPDLAVGPPVTFAHNRLVVVGKDQTGDLAELLSRRFAMGDPAHVPAGIYAKAALETIGIWSDVSYNAVFTENVRVALSLAARGDVGAAIVYATDARLVPGLAVAWRFDPELHPEIAYQAVLLKGSGEAGQRFMDILAGSEGRKILTGYGFLPGGNIGTRG
jgi:molybdate transport system substrate-binding protein